MLQRATDPERTMIAMVDGDGDRLALYTARSGYIGSGEQAAALLTAGLPARRLITTVVAPRMTVLMAQRHQPSLTLTQTEIGFKHLVTVAHPIQVVLDRLRHALPPTWRRDEASAGLVVFQHDPYGHIAVRTSGTEAATRLYIEAPAAILERLTSALATPCSATSRLSLRE